jgi:hypothetical protein
MVECLVRLLFSAALDFLKQWLRDWGTLLLTGVIATATVVQGLFAMRLYRLQQTIEKSRLEPLLFCRVKGDGLGGKFTRLDAQLSNLSTYGVWVDEMEIVMDGPVSCPPSQKLEVGIVLGASETKTWEVCSMPFSNIVPLGPGSATPVAFKLQAKFYYSAPSILGIQVSPLYDVILHGTVITTFKLESTSKTV